MDLYAYMHMYVTDDAANMYHLSVTPNINWVVST